MSPTASTSTDWHQLVPKGEHEHVDPAGTVRVQVVDDAALLALENKFRPKLLIDQEHWSYDPEKSSEAWGWVLEAQSRPDGFYGRIEWTDQGARAVTNARYRFLSPAFDSRDLQHLGGNRVRPLRLDSLGLTNKPNMQTLQPLLNRTGRLGAGMTQRKPRPQLIANRALPRVLANRGLVKITDVINDLKRVTGQNFESLWRTSQPLFNRFANRYGAVQGDEMWRAALAAEQEAFDKSFDFLDRSESEDRGNRLYKSLTQPREEFLKAIDTEMARGRTFEQAWDYLKQTEPVFWARHVFTITTNGQMG